MSDLDREDLCCAGFHAADGEWSFKAIERSILQAGDRKTLATPPPPDDPPALAAVSPVSPIAPAAEKPPAALPRLATPQLAAEVMGVTESQVRLLPA